MLFLYDHPGIRQRLLQNGYQLLLIGANERAINLMDKILVVYIDIPKAFYIKAPTYRDLDRPDKAVASIKKFLKASPLAHHFAGMCHMALEMYKKAEDQFSQVIPLNQAMGKSFVPMTIIEQLNGNLLRALNSLNLAKKKFNAAIFLNGWYGKALAVYPKLIILLASNKNTISLAAQYAKTLKAMSPEDPYSLDAQGWSI